MATPVLEKVKARHLPHKKIRSVIRVQNKILVLTHGRGGEVLGYLLSSETVDKAKELGLQAVEHTFQASEFMHAIPGIVVGENYEIGWLEDNGITYLAFVSPNKYCEISKLLPHLAPRGFDVPQPGSKFSISQSEMESLKEMAAPAAKRLNMPRSEVRKIVIELCKGRYLTVNQIANLINRCEASSKIIVEGLIVSGDLEALHPCGPIFSEFAYTTAGPGKKKDTVRHQSQTVSRLEDDDLSYFVFCDQSVQVFATESEVSEFYEKWLEYGAGEFMVVKGRELHLEPVKAITGYKLAG